MDSRSDSYRPHYDDDRGVRGPYSGDPHTNRFGDRYVPEPYPVRPISPAQSFRRFRSRERSRSRDSSHATSVYSPTTARIHSPALPYRGPPSPYSPYKRRRLSAEDGYSARRKVSRSPSSSRSSDVPGLTQAPTKSKPGTQGDIAASNSLHPTSHEGSEGNDTAARPKLEPSPSDEVIPGLRPTESAPAPKIALKKEHWDFDEPPGLSRVSDKPTGSTVLSRPLSQDEVIGSPLPAARSGDVSTAEDDQQLVAITSAIVKSASHSTPSAPVPTEETSGLVHAAIQPAESADESDMDMSLPPSPAIESPKDETLGRRDARIPRSHGVEIASSPPSLAVGSRDVTPAVSDMDMSPPISPSRLPANLRRESLDERRSSPSESAETRLLGASSDLLPRSITPRSTSVHPFDAPLNDTSECVGEDKQPPGDESDMEMSRSPSPARESSLESYHIALSGETSGQGIAMTLSSPLEQTNSINALPPQYDSTISPFSADLEPQLVLERAGIAVEAPSNFTSDEPGDVVLHDIPSENIDAQEVDSSKEDSATAVEEAAVDRLLTEDTQESIADKPVVSDAYEVANRAITDYFPEAHDISASQSLPATFTEGEAVEQPPEEIPGGPQSADNPLSQALRLVVMTRLRCDRQTREERVAPVFLANLATAESPSATVDPDDVIRDVFKGERLKTREDAFARARPSLQALFEQRQAFLAEKVQKLRGEYLALHQRWLVHCAKLDEVAKAAALEEAAATAGRTTRRSAALGDAVRTDLEMEQIIASLGNEELTDANHLAARNAAVIPDMISVEKGAVDYAFDDTNNPVEDTASFYTPNTCLEEWSEEEITILKEKYALYPKQFGIISDFLPLKTTAQCVTFYYLHKKTMIDFREIVAQHNQGKRRRGGRRDKKKGNALLTDIRKHDEELSRDSTPNGPVTRRRRRDPTAAEARRSGPSRRGTTQFENSPLSTPTPDPEPEPRRRRRAPKLTAKAVASLEQEADEDPTDLESKPRRGRRGRKVKETVVSPDMSDMPALYNETRFIDQTELTSRRRVPPGAVYWSEEDKELFLRLLSQYGDDFKRIAASMPNKTTIQVSVFYKANMAQLNLARVAASAPKRSPTPDTGTDLWKESSQHGSGVITPSTRASTPAALGHEPQLRTNERTRSARGRSTGGDKMQQSMSEFAAATSSSSFQFHSTSPEIMQAQYGSGASMGMGNPAAFNAVGMPLGDPIPMAGGSSAPLTTTFPSSFAYANLSPSHFAGEPRLPPRATPLRGVTPPNAPAAGTTMMFDAAMFTQPPWAFRSYNSQDDFM